MKISRLMRINHKRESSSAENNPSVTSGENQEETQPKIEENNDRELIHKKKWQVTHIC